MIVSFLSPCFSTVCLSICLSVCLVSSVSTASFSWVFFFGYEIRTMQATLWKCKKWQSTRMCQWDINLTTPISFKLSFAIHTSIRVQVAHPCSRITSRRSNYDMRCTTPFLSPFLSDEVASGYFCCPSFQEKLLALGGCLCRPSFQEKLMAPISAALPFSRNWWCLFKQSVSTLDL